MGVPLPVPSPTHAVIPLLHRRRAPLAPMAALGVRAAVAAIVAAALLVA
jgi:hypothetical protein